MVVVQVVLVGAGLDWLIHIIWQFLEALASLESGWSLTHSLSQSVILGVTLMVRNH